MPRCDLGTVAKQKATIEGVSAAFCASCAAPSANPSGYCAWRAGNRDWPAELCANRQAAVIRLVLSVPFLFFSFSYTLPLGLPGESIMQRQEEPNDRHGNARRDPDQA